jgi:hypothetical protein
MDSPEKYGDVDGVIISHLFSSARRKTHAAPSEKSRAPVPYSEDRKGDERWADRGANLAAIAVICPTFAPQEKRK